MTPFTDFLSYVLPLAPSVPEPLALQALRTAAAEFCQKTRSWRHVAEIDVVGDSYEVAPVPSQAILFEIEEAWFKLTGQEYGNPLQRIAFKQIDPNDLPEIEDTPGVAAPEYISQVDYETVILVPIAVGTLRISMFLAPANSADDAPDFLYDKFAQNIADGALASILMTPEQPYTNMQLGVMKQAAFNAFCDSKFNMNVRGQQRARARVRSSFF